jgi:hypothetical protein
LDGALEGISGAGGGNRSFELFWEAPFGCGLARLGAEGAGGVGEAVVGADDVGFVDEVEGC